MSLKLFDTLLVPGTNIGKQGFYQKSQKRALIADFSRPGGGSTVFNAQGQLVENGEDVPDWSFEGECPVLKMRAQAQNLFTFSEDFTHVSWGKINTGTGVTPIVTSNAGTAPNGTLTADRVQFNRGASGTISDQSTLQKQIFTSSGTNTTKSIWVKSFDGNNYSMALTDSGVLQSTLINVTPNWQLFIISGVIAGNLSNMQLQLREGIGGVTGQSQTADVLVWGGQLTESSIYLGYVPTNTTLVTRSANQINDFNFITDLSFTSLTQGSVFFKIKANSGETGAITRFEIKNSSGVRVFALRLDTPSISGVIFFEYLASSPVTPPRLDDGEWHKCLISCDGQNLYYYQDGVEIYSIDKDTFEFGTLERLNSANSIIDIDQGGLAFSPVAIIGDAAIAATS